MNDSAGSTAAHLSRHFTNAKTTTRIGGAAVLQELSNLASACIIGTTPAQDAVAFALSELFRQHAEDREDRIVTGDDTYLLVAVGDDALTKAVTFVEESGSSDQATCI